MTEILYDCELWEKTKILAQDKGFKMSDTCPMSKVCSGVYCNFIKPEETVNGKLQELRDELSEISAGYEGVKEMELGS